MQELHGLFADLESAVQSGRQEKRIEVLRKVTDLFLVGADRLKDEYVDIFDDVLARLTDQVESKVLAELSARLAPVDNAPRAAVRRLAGHDEIAVAGPVLARSQRLTDDDLIAIAKSKGQLHLGAISERARLAPAVTDVLVAHGDDAVARKLANNQGAAFSSAGMDALARRARADGQLAVNLVGRVDLPPGILQDLVARASDLVRERLMATASPEQGDAIQRAIDAVSSDVRRDLSAPRDFRRAERLLAELKQLGQLDQTAVVNFARAGQYEEMVVGLAMLCGAKVGLIEPLVQNPAYDGLLVACRASDIHWSTLSIILTKRFPRHPISAADLDRAKGEFLKLSPATAQRVWRFWLVRGVAQSH